MLVEYRMDAGDWQSLDEISERGRLAAVEWTLSDPGAASIQVRFIASDLGAGSLAEVADHDFRVETRGCGDAPCPGDLDGDGRIDGGDLDLRGLGDLRGPRERPTGTAS